MAFRPFADVDQIGARASFTEYYWVDEGVVDHHIRAGEALLSFQGEQTWIAGTCSNQIDDASGGLHERGA